MRRLFLLLILIFPALACNLGSAAAPTPTPAPPPILTAPMLGINPVVGAPGTVINVAAAGFPVNTRVNLYLSMVSAPSNTPLTTLTIGAGGILTFALQLPNQVGSTPVGNNMPLVFTLAAENGGSASALFLALGSGSVPGQPTPIPTFVGGGTGGNGNDLFITAPAIGSYLAGGSVVVTGSGSAANNTVGVQVQDANGNVLGSANAVIQATSGYIGPWEITVGFTQPAAQTNGYLVAFTAEGKQASIPVTFAGSGIQAPAPAPTAIAPTVPAGIRPIVTATKLFQ